MKKNFLKTVSSVLVITIIAKVLGLIRDIVFANCYGTGDVASAFFAATRIPTQIVDIILSSAITSTFIPMFNKIMQEKGKVDANVFANNFINIISIVATGICIVGVIFAPQIVNLLAGGFTENTYLLTVNLIRISFPMIIFTATAFSFVGFLQSYGQFNIPAMMSGLSNLVVILYLIFFKDKFGIEGVTVCMVIAWLLQVLIQLPFAKKFGYGFKFKIDFKDENIKKVFLLSIPILISTAVLPISNLVATRLASNISDDKLAALEYAYKLYLVIYGVFTYAVGNIIFPELSKLSTDKDESKFSSLINSTIRGMSYILIPLTAGIILYSKEIIEIVYQRGEFTQSSTLITSSALMFYSIGIIGMGLIEIMNKAFYAKQDTKSPLIIGISIVFFNIILSMILANLIGFNGITIAASITALVNAIVLTVVANRKNKGIINKNLIISLVKVILSAIVMSVIVLIFNHFIQINVLIKVILGAIIGASIYYGMTLLLKVEESQVPLNIIKGRCKDVKNN